MKNLRTKKRNIAICWNGLKNTAPREFPTMNELESTTAILDVLREAIPEFVESISEAEKMNTDIITGKIKSEDIAKARQDFFKKSTKIEMERGEKIVQIEFENEEFNTFFQQFGRWGKNWFAKLEAFLEFTKDMNDTNKQPAKGKK